MQVFRGWHHSLMARACALTIGNFDGVHRGHQAMLALLRNEAQHRGLPSCVMTFEPHPRDYFNQIAGRQDASPPRIATLRDRLSEMGRCGIDQALVLRFNAHIAALTPESFIKEILIQGLGARYVLVGDDFRFGTKRSGDYAMLSEAGDRLGFDVARMLSYEVHGLRVSSSAVRDALAQGDMALVTKLLGRPYSITGHVLHGRKLGRDLGFRTLNLRFPHHRPAAQGIFVAQVRGLGPGPLPGVASLGVRPTIEHHGQFLLEVHCLEWPRKWALEGGYGRLVQVDLLHKLHDEKCYESLDALKRGIQRDIEDAQAWLHQTTRFSN
jgi:riboflavin kinase/FMN adenylyltransferase